MIDYREWLREYKAFIARLQTLPGGQDAEIEIAAPISADELSNLRSAMRIPPPPEMNDFLRTATGACRTHYLWQPSPAIRESLRATHGVDPGEVFGGIEFADAERLLQWQDWCREAAEETWIADEPDEQERWWQSFPFAALANGDFVAIDMSSGTEARPVVCLCLSGQSEVIAPSFDAFLREWSRVCYIEPSVYRIQPYRHPASGWIDGTLPSAVALRKAFGLEFEQESNR